MEGTGKAGQTQTRVKLREILIGFYHELPRFRRSCIVFPRLFRFCTASGWPKVMIDTMPLGDDQFLGAGSRLYGPLPVFGNMTKGSFLSGLSFFRNAGLRRKGDADSGSHCGICNSGIGFAWNNFLHCWAVQRAQRWDFLLRALSVEMPLPAYICR